MRGEMPPQERPRPSVQETDAFLRSCRTSSPVPTAAAKRDPGRVTMRRLNRVEYNNTIRDLLGVVFDANELPQDDVGYGFDNIGDVLTISPLLMERYLAAAESIVPRAFPAEAPKPEVRHVDSRFLEPAINPQTDQGLAGPDQGQAAHSLENDPARRIQAARPLLRPAARQRTGPHRPGNGRQGPEDIRGQGQQGQPADL